MPGGGGYILTAAFSSGPSPPRKSVQCPQLFLDGDGSFGPQPMWRVRKEYSDKEKKLSCSHEKLLGAPITPLSEENKLHYSWSVAANTNSEGEKEPVSKRVSHRFSLESKVFLPLLPAATLLAFQRHF